uniref:Uncharacterized protein n=1 Tax=Rhizophora mucronata TaxID=61149 RepID=A0A2P2R1R5_RHIMU
MRKPPERLIDRCELRCIKCFCLDL